MIPFQVMLVVNPWHWLDQEGRLPTHDVRLRRRSLRLVQFIEYGGPLASGEARETLVECMQRPRGRSCLGLMWVMKTQEDRIHAFCPVCDFDEAMIHSWRETEWAEGPRAPVSVREPVH